MYPARRGVTRCLVASGLAFLGLSSDASAYWPLAAARRALVQPQDSRNAGATGDRRMLAASRAVATGSAETPSDAPVPRQPEQVAGGACTGTETVLEYLFDPTCGVGGDPDGGCNTIPPLFVNVQCGDTICGTVGTDGTTRDTDWFDLGAAAPRQIIWRGTTTFDSLAAIVMDDNSCVSLSVCAAQLSPPGPFSVCCLAPQQPYSRVMLFMAPQFTPIFPCGLDYHAEVACMCDAGVTVQEDALEPGCGLPVDNTNGGCNSATPVFTPLVCGDVVCGSYQENAAVRDTDWFSFSTISPGTITWSAEFDTPGFIAIIDANPLNCSAPTLLAFDFPGPCSPGVAQASATCGDYIAFAAPQFGTYPPCGTSYRARLDLPKAGQTLLGLIISGLGKCIGHPLYDPCADLNNDGCIDQTDLGILLSIWGQC